MSELTVWLRGHGLGGVLNALEGVEGSVVSAVQSNPQVQSAETQTVDEVGTAAQGVVVGAIAKVNPTAAAIAKEVSDPFLAGLEAYVLHFFQGSATVAAETKPAPEQPPAA